MSTTRSLNSTPLVSTQAEREEMRRKGVRVNKVFDAVDAYPGGFRAEFERRKRQEGTLKRLE